MSRVIGLFLFAASAMSANAQTLTPSLRPPDLRPSIPDIPTAPPVQEPQHPEGQQPTRTPEAATPTSTPSPSPAPATTSTPAAVPQPQGGGGAPWWLVVALAVVVAFLVGRAFKK